MGAAPVTSAIEEARRAPVKPPKGSRLGLWILQTLLHNLSASRAGDHGRPSAHLPFEDARWWVIPKFDSVQVTNAEGSGVLWYRRDRTTFLRMFLQTLVLRRRIRRRWGELSSRARAELPDLVSDETWARTLGVDGGRAD